MSNSQLTETAEQQAQFFAFATRSPILRRPDEYGMEYEDIHFTASDGTGIEGWLIPAKGSNKLIISNHFMPGNRYGYAGHLPKYNQFGGFEVNFLPRYRALHDAGYNILCYDLRNHGRSSDANGRIVGYGTLEYRDVIASLEFARQHAKLKSMEKALMSICLGANATLVAMQKEPEAFKGLKCMLALQPISMGSLVRKATDQIGDQSFSKLLADKIHELNGIRMSDVDMVPFARSVRLPTMVAQVRKDNLSYAEENVQEIFDNIPVQDKKLFWIEEAEIRFVGYNYFSDHPEEMIRWFDSHF